MLRNTAGQKCAVYAHDTVADLPKTGDAANITAIISQDAGAGIASNDLHPTEIGGGLYAFDLTQAESNCSLFALVATSSTSGVRIDPEIAYTRRLAGARKAAIYAHDSVLDAPKTGDAANITATISQDAGAGVASNDLHPTEIGGGLYVFELTEAEMSCDLFVLYPSSSTSGVRIDPVIAYMRFNSTIMLPVTSIGDFGGMEDTNLVAYRHAAFTFTLTLTDTNGDPVDLSGKLLAFIAWPPGKTTTIKIELTTDGETGDRVVVAGDDGNQVTVEGSDMHTATPCTLRWCLRDQDDDVMLIRGSFTIEDAADQAVIE